MGAEAFRRIDAYMELLDDGADMIEIGSERGEGSTKYLSETAKKHGFTFYSVDFEEEAYKKAKSLIGDNAFQMLGEDFLDRYENSKKQITFAYLDNFDFEYKHLKNSSLIEDQKKLYEKYDIELNNKNSQAVHLIQAKKVVKYASETCIIFMDDTFSANAGGYDGKGGLVVPYLLGEGWNILDSNLTGLEVLQYVVLINREVER